MLRYIEQIGAMLVRRHDVSFTFRKTGKVLKGLQKILYHNFRAQVKRHFSENRPVPARSWGASAQRPQGRDWAFGGGTLAALVGVFPPVFKNARWSGWFWVAKRLPVKRSEGLFAVLQS
jgi:hypothetical protein